jgi:hypothetical protein
MKHTMLLVCGLLLLAAFVPAAEQGVGLGVEAGATFPHGEPDQINVDSWSPSFTWGFYVNIPLIRSFHITPAARLYRLTAENATDIDLGFKFIVPLSAMDIYAGFSPGLTTVSEITAPHVGVLAGTSFNLVSNLDGFIQGRYSIVFRGNRNLRLLNGGAGILFEF